MKFIITLSLILLMTVAATTIQAELPTKRVLTLNAAKKIAQASEAEAIKRGGYSRHSRRGRWRTFDFPGTTR